MDLEGLGYAPYSIPERLLLASILDRAIRDLTDIDNHARETAILWFESSDSKHIEFSYKFIDSYLEIGAVRKARIKEMVKEAKLRFDLERKTA